MGKVWKTFPTTWLCPCLSGQVPESSPKSYPGWEPNSNYTVVVHKNITYRKR